jgi:hypothetical protein
MQIMAPIQEKDEPKIKKRRFCSGSKLVNDLVPKRASAEDGFPFLISGAH